MKKKKNVDDNGDRDRELDLIMVRWSRWWS